MVVVVVVVNDVHSCLEKRNLFQKKIRRGSRSSGFLLPMSRRVGMRKLNEKLNSLNSLLIRRSVK